MAQRGVLATGQLPTFRIIQCTFTYYHASLEEESSRTRYLVVDEDDDSIGYVEEHLREVFGNIHPL